MPVLLSAIGGKAYDLLRNLLVPAALKDKSLKELMTALKSHFEPKLLIIAKRFKIPSFRPGTRRESG